MVRNKTFGSKGSKQKRGTTMREINQNNIGSNFPKVESKKDKPQSAEVPKVEDAVAEKTPVTDDLSLAPEAVIGRSQVNKADSTEADMKTMLDNPDAVKKAVAFFDVAYNQLEANGSKNPYEKAAALTNAFKDELLN